MRFNYGVQLNISRYSHLILCNHLSVVVFPDSAIAWCDYIYQL